MPTTIQAGRTSEPAARDAMNPVVRNMFDLITRQGFMMMGATRMLYDNQNDRLSWAMGAGAKCTGVVVTFEESWDTYQLEFITQGNGAKKRKVFNRMYLEDVRPLIESETGFCLRVY